MARFGFFGTVLLIAAVGCGDVENPENEEENEVITTVELTFAPQSGGAELVFTWADPENDGDPIVEDIVLDDAEDYDVTVRFLNELEDPAEDITAEIEDEAEEHQVFFTGSAVQGPATETNTAAVIEHAYADEDAGGLPIGLDNTFATVSVGNGELTVTLRHLPPEDGAAVKVDDLAGSVAVDGISGIAGDTDVSVTFAIEVE
jgi:hypothetical protein